VVFAEWVRSTLATTVAPRPITTPIPKERIINHFNPVWIRIKSGMNKNRHHFIWVILGDLLALLIISIVGFASHNEAIDWRILTTYVPYLVAWLLIAPWLGVYQPGRTRQPLQVWRPMLAAFLAAPMAAWLRGIWLNRAILPVFILVLGLSAAFGFGIWRLAWSFISQRVGRYG
jgi:hypothetical protein